MKATTSRLLTAPSKAGCLLALAVSGLICPGAASPAFAQVTENVLHSFLNNGDGANPIAPLIADDTGPDGSLRGLYGTGGNGGNVFKLTPPTAGGGVWDEHILHEFGPSGKEPGEPGYGGLLALTKRITSRTALYGTTETGGKPKHSCQPGYNNRRCGTVFSLTGHKLTQIWDFTGGSDGGYPYFGVIADKTGALYTSTILGGGPTSCGTVVKLTPPAQGQTAWAETTLWTFTNGNDGCEPVGLIIDGAGALYGEAAAGGATGNGTVFKLIPPENGQGAWTEQTLWSFQGGSDGSYPSGTLAAGKGGVLYATTTAGGTTGNGTVFALTPPPKGSTMWGEQILWNFTGGADGGEPYAPLLIDKTGVLYGTAFQGALSANECGYYGAVGCGTVFKLTPPANGQTTWAETTLWQFTGGGDGGCPEAGLTADKAGVLYGTALLGGSINDGVVFSLSGTGFVP